MYAHPPAPILTVAVVGAESTGKTSLVAQLHILAQQHSVVCDSVHEHLRDWVVQHKRTPQTHEQQGIAQAQQQATQLAYNNLQHREPIETLAPTAATAKPSHASGIRLLLLDTTAILTAAYSAHYFNDHSLWAQAFSSEPQVDLYL
ncbi:MAG: AAA family ATPase, partial [Burkholderiaceae bacterium]